MSSAFERSGYLMIIRFVGQPFDDARNLHDFLTDTLENEDIIELSVVTAWAKRSGLRRIRMPLHDFRDRGGSARMILGIDEGGATKQGLELAMELFDEVKVFHDPAGRTFHPKIYVGRGRQEAHVFIGSNNFTAGGVFFNYEAGLDIRLDLEAEADNKLLEDLDNYVKSLLDEAQLCIDLNEEILAGLIASPRYRIRDEEYSRTPTTTEPEDTDQTAASDNEPEEDSPIFGRAQSQRRRDPSPPSGETVGGNEVPPATDDLPTTEDKPEPPEPAGPEPAERHRVVRRWTKRLARSDAQQPNVGSNPTGNLRLTQAGHSIDWRTFFRDDLFVTAPWSSSRDNQGNRIEIAQVQFEVVIRGRPIGVRELMLDHGPHRESGQANHVTVLHWGALMPILQGTSYIGDYVVIERLANDGFRLEIRPDAPPAIL